MNRIFLLYSQVIRLLSLMVSLDWSFRNKLLGVLALFAAVLVLLVLPVVNTASIRSSLYRPAHKLFFWLLVADYLILGYLGQQVPESPFIEIGQVASVFYFSYFLIIIPVLGFFVLSHSFKMNRDKYILECQPF